MSHKKIESSPQFTPEEMKRITDYVTLLHTIKQKINTKASTKKESQ